MLSYTEGNTFLPSHRLQTAENVLVSHLFLHNCFAHLIQKSLITKIFYFLLLTFTIPCGHDAVNVPDYPVFGTELPVTTIVLDDFSVPEENPLDSLGTAAYSFYLSSVLAICLQGYTPCCFIAQNSVILNSHIPFSELFLSLLLYSSDLFKIINAWPTPTLSDRQYSQPDFILPPPAFPDPKLQQLNYSHQHH